MSFMQSNKKDHDSGSFNENVQCFPLYSMLLASNGMSVDFLSLNAGGQGIKILKTIPWKNVNIKVALGFGFIFSFHSA